jgi:hypothetical protein
MNSVIYHRAEVENSKASYGENDDLLFFINAEGRALLKNSVRLVGEVRVNKNRPNVRITKSDDVNMDNVIGIHNVIDNLSVEMDNVGVVEQFSEVSRYVKMTEIGERDLNDNHAGSRLCELKTPQEAETRALLSGFTNNSSGATADEFRDIDFSCKVQCCLNKMSDNLSFSKSGLIRLNIRLNKINQTLYGIDCDANNNYELRNVRVEFKSVPDEMNEVQMRTILSLKNSINSSLSNTMSKVPAVVDGVSCCFLEQSKENSLKDCNTSMDVLPSISEVQFLFQDSTSQYISYVIDSRGQMLDLFVDSLRNSGHNMINVNHNNTNFGIGVSFEPVDLSNQKFNIQIKSDTNTLNTNPFIIYQFFHSFISL